MVSLKPKVPVRVMNLLKPIRLVRAISNYNPRFSASHYNVNPNIRLRAISVLKPTAGVRANPRFKPNTEVRVIRAIKPKECLRVICGLKPK